MALKRFLPDLLVIAMALCAGPPLRRFLPAGCRFGVSAGSALLVAGFVVTVLQAFRVQAAFAWMLVGGAALAWAVAVLAAVLAGYGSQKIPASDDRRKLLTAAALAVPVAVFGYGTFIGRRQFHLREVDLPVPGLPAGLDGLRIAQLSDIHLSPFLSRADLQWCVAMANETRPQLAAVTGDLITGIRDSIDDCLEDLRHLRADAGIFGCNGNHERYVGGEAYTVERAARLGMRFLRRERTTLRFGDAVVNLAGVDHFEDRWSYARESEGLLRPGEFNLLLNHNPEAFPHIAEQGWDLTLAGHLHGGQINLELASANLNALTFTTPYIYGAYREGRSSLYVTRGIGTIGVPIRIGAPPEVALLRLRAAPAEL